MNYVRWGGSFRRWKFLTFRSRPFCTASVALFLPVLPVFLLRLDQILDPEVGFLRCIVFSNASYTGWRRDAPRSGRCRRLGFLDALFTKSGLRSCDVDFGAFDSSQRAVTSHAWQSTRQKPDPVRLTVITGWLSFGYFRRGEVFLSC
jgi:hypothetical protein